MGRQLCVRLQMLRQGGQRGDGVLGHAAREVAAGHCRLTRPGGALSRVWNTSSCERRQLTMDEASKCVLSGAMIQRSRVFCLRNVVRAGRNTHAARLSAACLENIKPRTVSVEKRENERKDARLVDGKSGRW